MKRSFLAGIALFLLSGLTAAQSDTSEGLRSTTQVLNDWVTNIEQLLVPAVDAMPEPKFAFVPTNGEFQGVRTFGEQVKHLAAANYQLGSRILCEATPP